MCHIRSSSVIPVRRAQLASYASSTEGSEASLNAAGARLDLTAEPYGDASGSSSPAAAGSTGPLSVLNAPPSCPSAILGVLERASHTWLRNEEIFDLLTNWRSYGFDTFSEAPSRPPGGALYLFDRHSVRYFRKDGHDWRKKTDGRSVRETHEKLKVNGSLALNCYYAHSIDNKLQRRSYWLLDNDVGMVLVHYAACASTRRALLMSAATTAAAGADGVPRSRARRARRRTCTLPSSSSDEDEEESDNDGELDNAMAAIRTHGRRRGGTAALATANVEKGYGSNHASQAPFQQQQRPAQPHLRLNIKSPAAKPVAALCIPRSSAAGNNSVGLLPSPAACWNAPQQHQQQQQQSLLAGCGAAYGAPAFGAPGMHALAGTKRPYDGAAEEDCERARCRLASADGAADGSARLMHHHHSSVQDRGALQPQLIPAGNMVAAGAGACGAGNLALPAAQQQQLPAYGAPGPQKPLINDDTLQVLEGLMMCDFDLPLLDDPSTCGTNACDNPTSATASASSPPFSALLNNANTCNNAAAVAAAARAAPLQQHPGFQPCMGAGLLNPQLNLGSTANAAAPGPIFASLPPILAWAYQQQLQQQQQLLQQQQLQQQHLQQLQLHRQQQVLAALMMAGAPTAATTAYMPKPHHHHHHSCIFSASGSSESLFSAAHSNSFASDVPVSATSACATASASAAATAVGSNAGCCMVPTPDCMPSMPGAASAFGAPKKEEPAPPTCFGLPGNAAGDMLGADPFASLLTASGRGGAAADAMCGGGGGGWESSDGLLLGALRADSLPLSLGLDGRADSLCCSLPDADALLAELAEPFMQ